VLTARFNVLLSTMDSIGQRGFHELTKSIFTQWQGHSSRLIILKVVAWSMAYFHVSTPYITSGCRGLAETL
jgi:hypothetical protein